MIHDIMTPKVEGNTQEFTSEQYLLQPDYSIVHCPKSNYKAVENEAAVTEEADVLSSVEPNEEGNLTQGSDIYKDLCGINSDNLMKFSQQSEIEDLYFREMLNSKKNRVLPVLEEHDNSASKFKINLNVEHKGKANWHYSEKTKKLYIKPHEIIDLEVAYKSSLACDKLYIRAMMVFSKQVSDPVLRCLNHSSKDNAIKENTKQSLLRCENSHVSYVGKIDGKNISDRLSVLIPIGRGTKSKGSDLMKEIVALKFTCQNSCVGRQETSVIFYLENLNEDILAQRIIDVKVCSCPKRDKALEEKNLDYRPKRKNNDEAPIPRKVTKNEKIKRESPDNAPSNYITQCADGSYQISMNIPDKESACHIIQCAYNTIGVRTIISPNFPNCYNSAFREMQNLLESAQRLS